MFFYVLIFFIIFQRIIELLIAKKNAKYIQALGGIEVGQVHYPFIVITHILFFISLSLEGSYDTMPTWWPVPFIAFLLAQILRIWVLTTLGRFWNTRIYVVPGSKPIKNGPYRFLRHPNYLTVIIEILAIPLIFGAYYTAFAFSIINLGILFVRIRVEEQALIQHTDYLYIMGKIPRFFGLKPTRK